MGDRGPHTVRFDPHVHTDASHDCSTPLGDVLAAAAEADLDAIAITDHDAIDVSLAAVERAPEHGLTAIPGVEVSTAAGHLLALFVTDRPPAGRPLGDTVDAIRDRGGLAVVPHPFQVSRHGIRKRRLAAADVDAVEAFNALTMTGVQNLRARRFAASDGCAAVGASDAHTRATVGRAHTVLDLPSDRGTAVGRVPPAAIRDAIEAGACQPGGEGATVAQCVGKYARMLGSQTARLRPRRPFSGDRP